MHQALGQCLSTFCLGICFGADSYLLAISSHHYTIKLWDTGAWQCVSTLAGHEEIIDAVCFSPTRQWLASGEHDRSVKSGISNV